VDCASPWKRRDPQLLNLPLNHPTDCARPAPACA
jgi:hypothetical protein